MFKELFMIFFAASITNNFVLTKFLGVCPFLGVSKKLRSAFGMGVAVTFTMIIATIASWLIEYFILAPFGYPFLRYAVFILVIASLVQFIEMFLKKYVEDLFKAFGIYLPLITTNCAILGVVLLSILTKYTLVESIVFAFGAGVGFTIALLIMAGIRERLEFADIPEALKGVPIAFIIAGILALAFSGMASIV